MLSRVYILLLIGVFFVSIQYLWAVPKIITVKEDTVKYEEGVASYYHGRFHGRKSSSGRVHDKNELVAAHRTYPFGTFLRVTNLTNMKSVIVCVTDRGPYRSKRVIDLSESAAKALDFIEKGITRVRIEEVPGPLDLRYLDLIYPKFPYPQIGNIQILPPYKFHLGR